MPRAELTELWPEVESQRMIAMPEPPDMPIIDWAEIAPAMPAVPTIEDIPINPEDD
jgi:hypothetical protein